MKRKWIVVTGGTKGIGKGILEAFLKEGFNGITCARKESDLLELKRSFEVLYPESQFLAMTADLSSKKNCLSFGDFVNSVTDQIEVLVNNAGYFLPGQIQTEEDGVLESMLNANVASAYHVTRSLMKGMVKRKGGHIFNICSTASIVPYINGGSYCISKHALHGMSKVLREELKEHNVRVTSVLPGATLTASWVGTKLPEHRFMKIEDVAEAVLGCWKLSERTVIEELLIRPQLGDI